MTRGKPTRPSCDMCAYGCKRVMATQDIIYGGKVYSVCDKHAANPIANPHRSDFGPAPDNGTATSQKAARETDGKVTVQCYTVLGVLAAAGPEGLIREQIYQRAEITNQAACGRLNELEAQGLVIVDGERRSASTRKTQQVYRLAAFAMARAA